MPVFCHADDKADAEGDGGEHYFHFERLNPLGRLLLPRLLHVWDGGPVQIAGTLAEGDDIAGFKVIHLPGHAPGQIGLWRESDRLALTSDCFYTLDPQTGLKGHAARPARRVQPGHRAGARVDPQARRAGARGGLARATPTRCAATSRASC